MLSQSTSAATASSARFAARKPFTLEKSVSDIVWLRAVLGCPAAALLRQPDGGGAPLLTQQDRANLLLSLADLPLCE